MNPALEALQRVCTGCGRFVDGQRIGGFLCRSAILTASIEGFSRGCATCPE
jgi:hypothetical protein